MSFALQPPAFADTVVAVTGAAAGIGRAIAANFAACGARLALIDVDEAGLANTAEGLRARSGPVRTYPASVADEQAMKAVAARVEGDLGRCDVLVNNAGVLLRGRVDAEDAANLWRRTLDVNLSGAFYASRAFLPLLRAQGGCIVNVASIHACVAIPNSAAYTASKGGIKQLTQALAQELAPLGIRVNAVAPGMIATAMTQQTRDNPQATARFLQRVPLARVGEADDVAHAVLFLASEFASYITGVTLPVDGGYLAG